MKKFMFTSIIGQKKSQIVGVFISLVVGLIYFPARNIYLMGDDFDILNLVYSGWSTPAVLFQPLNNFFRLTVKISFFLNYTLFKTSAISYIVITLCIHILNIFLLYRFLLKVTSNIWIAGAISLAFGTSPFYSEVTLWNSSRSDSLVLTFALGIFLLLSQAQDEKHRKYQYWVLFLMLGSACTKENWIILPLLSFSFLVLFQRFSVKDAVQYHAFVFLLLIGYVSFFILFPYFKGDRALGGYPSTDISAMLTKFAFLLYRYIGLGDWFTNKVWQIILLLFLLIVVLSLLILLKVSLGLWGFLWMITALLPTLPIKYAASRFNYLPLVGFWIMSITLIHHIGRWIEQKFSAFSGYFRVFAVGAMVYIVGYQSIMVQWEITDYRQHAKAHETIVHMFRTIQMQLPKTVPFLFLNRGNKQPISELEQSYQGYPKLLFRREEAIWQLINFAPLANFAGEPFRGIIRELEASRIPLMFRQAFQVVIFTDEGFRVTEQYNSSIRNYWATYHQLPPNVKAFEYISLTESYPL